MMHPRPLMLVFVAAFVVAGAWAALRSAPPPPDVVLIVIDSLRADCVDARPGAATPMPFVSRLGARGVFYERAYAASSWTLPSIASMFTAQYPSEHQARWWGHPIADNPSTLAALLRLHGYATAGFSAHAAIGAKHNLDQGFDSFVTVGDPKPFALPDASEVNAAALQWVETNRSSGRPYFLFLHFMDVHIPYRPHPGLTAPRQADVATGDLQLSVNVSQGSFAKDETRKKLWSFSPAERRRLRELYDGEARYVDGKLEELLAALDKKSDGRDRLVVITADHGEEFGEHGIYGHATSLYEAVRRVPLVVLVPGAAPRRVAAPVSVGGIAPALLVALGIAAPPALHIPGFPMRDAKPEGAPTYAYAELLDTETLPLRVHASAVVGATAALLETPSGEQLLYADDPAESTPRQDEHWAGLLRAAREVARSTITAGEPARQVELDALTKERLHNLGYGTDK